jgi:hypothetical protein
MEKIHRHRKFVRGEDYGWTSGDCPTPDMCAAQPQRQVAHGGIRYTIICRCGATQKVEANASRINRGPWISAGRAHHQS